MWDVKAFRKCDSAVTPQFGSRSYYSRHDFTEPGRPGGNSQ